MMEEDAGVVNALLSSATFPPVYTRATLLAALAGIGSTTRTLFLPVGTWTIDDDLTLPANVTLWLPAGASLQVASGKTVTLHGPVRIDGCGVFSGAGVVVLPTVTDVNVCWFGVVCDGTTLTGAALQRALDTVPVGTRLTLPPGICQLNTALTISRSLTLEGAGMTQTTLRQTVPNIPVLTIMASNVMARDLTVSHSGTAVSGGDGLIVRGPGGVQLNAVTLTDMAANTNFRGFVLGGMAYAQASHLWAISNNNHGFEFLYEAASGGTCQWDVLHAISEFNLGAGFSGVNTAGANGIGPWITQSITFANDFGGFSFSGIDASHPISDIRLSNVISSYDNRGGIYLNTFGGSHGITNPFIERVGQNSGLPMGSAGTSSVASNNGHGLAVTVNNLYGVNITGGTYWNNAWSGLSLEGVHTQLVGGQSLGNGVVLDPALSRRAGVHIGNDDVLVSGHTFQYIGAPATLHYIHLSSTVTHTEIGHNSYDPLLGSPAWVDASEVSGALTQFPTMAAGLNVHTSAPQAFALGLLDATNGANPRKFLRVVGGQFQVLNSAATTVIQGLSDAGTPSWPNRRGQVQIADTNSTATVTLSPAEPDTSYFVQVTPVQAVAGPAVGALTIVGVTKAPGSFVLTVVAAPGAGKSVFYDWLVYR